jgi:hypothetical protein
VPKCSFVSKIAVIETPYFIKWEKNLTATQVLWDSAPWLRRVVDRRHRASIQTLR